MSGGVHLKVISQNQGDSSVSSSLSLPRSSMPLSKMDPRQQHYSSLPHPSAQSMYTSPRRSSYSSSASSNHSELLKGLKSLHPKTDMYPHRSPVGTERNDGTCSAYSSPQIPKREAPRSKDTLDIRASTLTHKALRDLQMRRNVNKNWTFGKYRMKSATEEVDPMCNIQPGPTGGRLLYSKGTNGNDVPKAPMVHMDNIRKDVSPNVRNNSNQDQRGQEVSGDRGRSSYPIFNSARTASEPGKINMAAVAPFRFRFQVQEEMDATLDDLSDCSSDSMEVCCEDLGKL